MSPAGLTRVGYRNNISYMKRNSRLSVALHVLAHLAERSGEPATSEHLAACAGTNPVVIRRTLAGLREAGLVASAKGHGGGWTLARDPGAVSLADVTAALGERLLFAVDVAGPKGAGCVVQHAVSGVMDGFLRDAEALLAERLGRISLADLAEQIRAARGHHTHTGGVDVA
jgi:Rrf2 family protein